MFSDERKKLKTHTHIYTNMCIHIQKKREKELPVNLKPQNSPRYHIYLTPQLGLDMTQGQFLSGV